MQEDKPIDSGGSGMDGQPVSNEDQRSPGFAKIVSSVRKQSAARLEQLRKDAEALEREQQLRWRRGVELLNQEVRPVLERALQACAEEGIPALLEDNFTEHAATARLMFHCSAQPIQQGGRQVIGPASIKMVVESDGDTIRAGTAKSFSTYPEGMRRCDDVEACLTVIFSTVLESYFQSYERTEAQNLKGGAGS